MVIYVRELVASCTTNDDGEAIFHKITDALETDGFAEVDFSDVTNATSSFVNSAFVPLLACRRLEVIKRVLKVRNVHPQIADMIRSRLSYEDGRVAA